MINELWGFWSLEHFLIPSVGNDHLVSSVLGRFVFCSPRGFIPIAQKGL